MGKFEDMGRKLGELSQLKNASYGDSFSKSGEVMFILYPNGIAPEQYRDALGVIRVIDKLFRIATRKEALGESPWRDIGGYGIVAAVADEENEDGGTVYVNQHIAQHRPVMSVPLKLEVGARVRCKESLIEGLVKEYEKLSDTDCYNWFVSFGQYTRAWYSADELEVLPPKAP